MKKLSCVFYVAFPPVYSFIIANVLAAFNQYMQKTYSHFFTNIILQAVLFIGFGLFVLWKSISKSIKSMSKTGSTYLNIAAILIQITLICTTIGILGTSTLILYINNTIFMLYISLGFDIGMLIHNIRRSD